MLHSKRLHLRALEPDDADFMYDVENDVEAWRYSDTIAPLSRTLLRDYALNYDADPFSAGQLRLIITEEGDETPVGIADLYDITQRHRHAFIGIYICPEWRGKGYAEETIELLEDYARNSLHLHQLGAKVEENHDQASKIFLKCGFKQSAKLDEWLSMPDGKFVGMRVYTKFLSGK